MEIIKINKLMEDQKMKDTRFFLMEFGREVMKSIGEELTEKYGHGNFADEELRLQIIVNDKEVKSSDFCHSFLDCLTTNMEKMCRQIVSGLFNEKINNIMCEFEEMQSKAESMNNSISWDDVFNKKFIKTESNERANEWRIFGW